MNTYKTLFEKQSYQDALDYYLSLVADLQASTWDYVILTASNEAQALAYEVQIEHRLQNKQIPAQTHYAVIPDLNGQRVGSGGATFSCIKYVAERESSFANKKILVIHSGGDSKRVPQYSACGKLFSPVPRLLPDGRRSTLFDEFMIGMSTVASRISEGMLVCSGDVLLLFNALQIDFYGAGAAALSIKEHVETGKNHGVYLKDEAGNVGRFLHKQTVETLTEVGAVDSRNNVDIDTGAVILSVPVLNDLYGLIDTQEKYYQFVNEKARLSFYADFLYPLASESTLEQFYLEKPEGDYTEELAYCRKRLWEALSPYQMKLIRFSPASFIHFGTTKELLHLMADGIDKYQFLGWSGVVNSNLSPKDYAVSNSYISKQASVGSGCYIEDSLIHEGTVIGAGCVISGVTLNGECVPAGTVLHGLKLKDGRFVCRRYGVNDNPKDNGLFGVELDIPLWNKKLYPVCDTIEEAVKKTLSGEQSEELLSLMESFNQADVTAILPWQERLYAEVVAESILDAIDRHITVDDLKQAYVNMNQHTINYLLDKANKLDITNLEEFSRCIRIYGYLGKLTGEALYTDKCFETICAATLSSAMNNVQYDASYYLAKEVIVRRPVRVNWGGGWSDTPPYCMENGGTVLNAAIALNGCLPIEVSIQFMNKPIIALASTDIGSYKEFDNIAELQDCRNPADPFALHKAALLACGVIPMSDNVSVQSICEHLGHGMYINTRVIDIPKGSGLGTSSILAGACVEALYKAFDIEISEETLFKRVLCMEQLMSTGGGWQDQVGGIVPGIKMITTQAGLSQQIKCVPLNITNATIDELNERFALIYTGQRRLARNLLRDVVGRYVSNNAASVDAHYNIQRLAVLMRFELEKGNVDGFAKLLTEHWAESQRIDEGCTNTCIDQIFTTIDDLIDGKMICGAGGGGFLQVVLKRGITKDTLRARLNEVFQDSGVDVWECAFV